MEHPNTQPLKYTLAPDCAPGWLNLSNPKLQANQWGVSIWVFRDPRQMPETDFFFFGLVPGFPPATRTPRQLLGYSDMEVKIEYAADPVLRPRIEFARITEEIGAFRY